MELRIEDIVPGERSNNPRDMKKSKEKFGVKYNHIEIYLSNLKGIEYKSLKNNFQKIQFKKAIHHYVTVDGHKIAEASKFFNMHRNTITKLLKRIKTDNRWGDYKRGGTPDNSTRIGMKYKKTRHIPDLSLEDRAKIAERSTWAIYRKFDGGKILNMNNNTTAHVTEILKDAHETESPYQSPINNKYINNIYNKKNEKLSYPSPKNRDLVVRIPKGLIEKNDFFKHFLGNSEKGTIEITTEEIEKIITRGIKQETDQLVSIWNQEMPVDKRVESITPIQQLKLNLFLHLFTSSLSPNENFKKICKIINTSKTLKNYTGIRTEFNDIISNQHHSYKILNWENKNGTGRKMSNENQLSPEERARVKAENERKFFLEAQLTRERNERQKENAIQMITQGKNAYGIYLQLPLIERKQIEEHCRTILRDELGSQNAYEIANLEGTIRFPLKVKISEYVKKHLMKPDKQVMMA